MEDLHIPVQGNNKLQIIIDIEESFSMSTALVSGILTTIYHDVRCYFCYLQISHKNCAPASLVELYKVILTYIVHYVA